MAKKEEYERVSGGTFGVYRKKPKKSFWDDAGEVIGGIVVVALVLVVIGAIFG